MKPGWAGPPPDNPEAVSLAPEASAAGNQAPDAAGALENWPVLSVTESLCPVCLAVLKADIYRRGDEIFLARTCPEHGHFAEAIWRGEPRFEDWRRPKEPAQNVAIHRPAARGCPYDCGLCPEHAQHPCTILLEITDRCNLGCPVCYASSGGQGPGDLDTDTLIGYLKYIRTQAGPVVLQISGGEPTLHPGLPKIIKAASLLFPAVQLNTNGLELATDPSLALELKRAGLSWVFLQFDSLDDETLVRLRGAKLAEVKKAAVDNLEKAGQPTVLVPTVAKGLNDGHLGALVRYALDKPLVRGLHFQPMTQSGRNGLKGSQNRLTLPELLTLLGQQTDGAVDPKSAFPPGCEHERCSFHLRYRRLEGRLIPSPGTVRESSGSCCGPPKTTTTPSRPEETAASRNRAVDIILRSWSPGGLPKTEHSLIPMAARKPDAFDEFIQKAARESFSLTAMAFQDAWTMDLARLRGCCVHVFLPPDRFVPFCAMNLTSADDRALYRP